MREFHASYRGGRLPLGKQGENKATRILFPFTDFKGYSIAVLHQRATDMQPYPITAAWSDDGLVWIVSNVDTGIVGAGKLEIHFSNSDGTLAKSVTYHTSVDEALTEPSEEPPDPYSDWYEEVLAASGEAESAKIAAADSATAAASSASSAAASASEAENAKSASAASAATATEKASEASLSAAQVEESVILAGQKAASAINSANAAAESAAGIVTAEAERVSAENEREAAEITRTAAEDIRAAAETARVSAEAARESFVTQLKQDVAAGKFDGSNGVSTTHSWNGTKLTVTSASGTSSADLKGEKGDPGSDASVTSVNIATALGYTPANESTVSEISQTITSVQTAVLSKASTADVSTLKTKYNSLVVLLGQVKTALESGNLNEAVSLLDTFLLGEDGGVLE